MQNMQDMLNKLELMLVGLKQMKINIVFTWFPKMNKDEVLKAISESPKFKIEGDVVSLKSETEIYEEELQKDILKELMDDEDEVEDILDYDDDIELLEVSVDEDNIVEIDMSKDIIEDIEVSEIDEDVTLQSKDIDNIWANVQELAKEVSGESKMQTQEDSNLEVNNDSIENIAIATEINELAENINEVEKIVEKTVVVKDTSELKGSDIEYNELIRLISEYNHEVQHKIETTDENKYENKEKAIIKFYENKYIVKVKENNTDINANIFSLIHKKKGMEVAYLVVSETLDSKILNFMLENYEDEVVYFCPIQGCEVEFEVDLNEFYLKETSKIFDKYLERYVITEENACVIKKGEIVIGR